MTLRSGAIVGAVWSLRGRIEAEVAPSERAVPYAAPAPGVARVADLYWPARPRGASVVLVHGGAFVIGSRRMRPMRLLASRLVDAGVAVCAIDYRMIFRGGRLDEASADVGEALVWWRARATARGLDPRAISVIGLSAGGCLAMLAAGQPGAAWLHRVAGCFGLYDVDHLQGPIAERLPRMLFRSADRAAWRARVPAAAPPPPAPVLLLHGEADGLVPVDQARRLAARRAALGLATRLVVYPGAPHGFFNFPTTPAAMSGIAELVAHVTAPP